MLPQPWVEGEPKPWALGWWCRPWCATHAPECPDRPWCVVPGAAPEPEFDSEGSDVSNLQSPPHNEADGRAAEPAAPQ